MVARSKRRELYIRTGFLTPVGDVNRREDRVAREMDLLVRCASNRSTAIFVTIVEWALVARGGAQVGIAALWCESDGWVRSPFGVC